MIQSEKRILFLAESSLKGENPQLWKIRLKERSPCVSPRNHQHSAYSTRGAGKGAWGDPCTRPAGARVTCGVSALPPGAGPGARRGGGAGPTRGRSESAAEGGGGGAPSDSVAALASLRAAPGPLPEENRAKGRLLPNNSALHGRNNAGGETREPRGREPESRESRLRGSSGARAQYFT